MIKAQTMKQMRRIHLYIGVFFTPAILLFALSGALQTFRLQEEKGYGGTPPAWIVWMASVHKDSSMPRDRGTEHKDRRPAASVVKTADASSNPPPAHKGPSRLPMRAFVVLLSIGLIISSSLGVAIALNNKTTRRASFLALFAGTVLPLLLMLN
ncbi:MAG: hypothetical protein ABWZ74_11030 [Hyphomicrobiaceae bacterium]